MLGKKKANIMGVLWEKRANNVCNGYKKFLQMSDKNGLKDLSDVAKVHLFDIAGPF